MPQATRLPAACRRHLKILQSKGLPAPRFSRPLPDPKNKEASRKLHDQLLLSQVRSRTRLTLAAMLKTLLNQRKALMHLFEATLTLRLVFCLTPPRLNRANPVPRI